MKIIRFFAIFTIVRCIPFPPDPGDSEPEIIADNLPSSDSDSGSDKDVIIVTDPPVIRIPSSPDNSGPEDMDEQPPFLPNGVTGHEVIQQTPELIRVWVRAPESLRNFDPDDLYHPGDRHLQPSTSTGARRGLTLRREWARLARVSCLARRTFGEREEPRRNIGN